MIRRFTAASVALLALAACSTADPQPPSTDRATDRAASPSATAVAVDVVDVRNFSYEPKVITVAPGTTVTWRFHDQPQHDVAATDRAFASELLTAGQEYTHTFPTAGTYDYLCTVHQYMTGTVIVR